MKNLMAANRWAALSLGTVSAIALAPAAIAQYSIPVTNGSFAITNTGNGNQFTTPTITLLSPAGTLTGIAASPQVHFQPGITLTDQPTAIGIYLEQVNGAVSLNDGRSGTFAGGVAGLETDAVMSGATTNWQPVANGYFQNATVPLNSTVSFNIKNGYLTFPTANLSAYPATNVNIPISGGTFEITALPNAAPETITLTGLVTPLGTANLTIANPILVNPRNYYPITLIPAEENVLLGGVATGAAALGNGETANFNNATFLFTGTAQVSTGVTYTLPRIYPDTKVVTGQLGQGVISIPRTALQTPPTAPVGRPEPTVPPLESGGGSVNLPGGVTQPTPSGPIAGRPQPAAVVTLNPPTDAVTEAARIALVADNSGNPPASPEFSLARNVTLGMAPTNFLPGRSQPLAIAEEDGSPLRESRVHPGLGR